MKTLSLIVVFLLPSVAIGDHSCLDENGQIADWYVLYKLPINTLSSNSLIAKGEAFLWLDLENGKWVLSSKSISDMTAPLGRTIIQAKNESRGSFLIYNDEDPSGIKSGSTYGHLKGILYVNDEGGFWLVHSIPKFPVDPRTGDFSYPSSGKMHGQSILCLSFKPDMLEKIVRNFLYTRPSIYARHAGEGIETLPDDLKGFFRGVPKYVTSPPWNYTTEVTSAGGQTFTLFGKHKKWNKDLYDGMVAPVLESSLLTETWRLGSGDPLTSTCGVPYTVENVKKVRLSYGQHQSNFSSTLDHSKWAAAHPGGDPWVCIGDINRMASQEKRGGGTVCTKCVSAWTAFTSSVVDTESCRRIQSVQPMQPLPEWMQDKCGVSSSASSNLL